MARKIFTDESLSTFVDEIKSYTDESSATRATKGHGIYYGTCSTYSDVTAKIVTLTDSTGFSLTTGAVVVVKFTYANRAESPTLNVNSTGAKSIMRYGTTAVSNGTTDSGWMAESVQMFIYDGTNWVRDYWYNTTYSNASMGQGYATCTTAASTTAKIGTLSNYTLSTDGIISVKFTYGVPASATLNINNKGAKAIYYRGGAITANIIEAGDIATFIFDGRYYHLISIDRWQEDIISIQTVLDGKSDSNHTHNYAGKNVEGEVFTDSDGTEVTAKSGAEIFNDYSSNIASGTYSHAEGFHTIASGNCSHAEGFHTTASGTYSHTEGNNTTASGSSSHAEGSGTTASGNYSHAEGSGTTASGSSSHAAGYYTTADNYQYVIGKYNSPRNPITSVDTVYNVSDSVSTTYPALFIVGNGTDDTSRSNAFTVYANGKCKGLSSFGSSGADYARQYEWLDGNPNNEDRRGLLVILDGSKIRIATPDDNIEDCEGIVSTCPAFVENDPDEWHDRYLKDVFGRRITQEVVIPEETITKSVEKIDGETGETIIEKVIEVIPEHTIIQFVVNPEYDPEQEYVCRDVRPEWTTVGFSGFIVAVDDGTCQVNGYCTIGENGSLTMSETRTPYRVMERKDDNHILVRIK